MYDSYYYYQLPRGSDSVWATFFGLGMVAVFICILVIALVVLMFVGLWKMFKKANYEGYEALIGGHSTVVMLEMGGLSKAWFFLNLIAIFGIGPIILSFYMNIKLAQSFGKGVGYGILMTFFPYIMYPILGLGDAKYIGPQNNNVNNNNNNNVYNNNYSNSNGYNNNNSSNNNNYNYNTNYSSNNINNNTNMNNQNTNTTSNLNNENNNNGNNNFTNNMPNA